ncbi:septation ring formation regulator EzrA [Cytobacillus sp. IB215665]|uniref:septation ring formation regulator EzrA n=1 Tax=Cytobacillus sp. IB215665 TaxID=3097357 RepID=UPI002A1329F3|nr:septation ring formation regulator EzrA [Cytobacillus sp. IB215665]MDX8367511.1 septation ring formation regulator EzrA [Cytobacillus sp. IB215665]
MDILLYGIISIILITVIFSIYMRKKMYKEIDRLDAIKIEIMNRPVTDEMSKVKDLHMTGQTEELFERWRKEWDEIITLHLPNVEELLFDAEEYTDKYRFSKSKEVLLKIDQLIKDVEDNIATILKELEELVGSEEQNRLDVEEFRKIYKNIKKDLLGRRHLYGKAETNLESQLDELEKEFLHVDEITANGDYLEAKEALINLSNNLKEMQSKMEQLPQLLTECQGTIPNQLEEIHSGYLEMSGQGYKLDHIPVEIEVERIRTQLSKYIDLIEKTEIHEVSKELDETKENIETLYDLLEKEVLAHHFINHNQHNVSELIRSLKEETNETREESLFVQQLYHLDEEEIAKYHNIENQIGQLQKRYTAIVNKKDEEQLAYTIVREELESCLEGINDLREQHEQFKEMLQNLRKDELFAREKTNEMKKQLMELKRKVQKSNIPGIPASYQAVLSETKNALEQVFLKLEEKPLDMVAINQLLAKAVEQVNASSSMTDEMIEQAYLVEKVIQYGNRYRSKNKKLAEQLKESEVSFRSYDYSLSLEQAATAIEEIEPGALSRIEEMLENK